MICRTFVEKKNKINLLRMFQFISIFFSIPQKFEVLKYMGTWVGNVSK